jgi:hypothetical protein
VSFTSTLCSCASALVGSQPLHECSFVVADRLSELDVWRALATHAGPCQPRHAELQKPCRVPRLQQNQHTINGRHRSNSSRQRQGGIALGIKHRHPLRMSVYLSIYLRDLLEEARELQSKTGVVPCRLALLRLPARRTFNTAISRFVINRPYGSIGLAQAR